MSSEMNYLNIESDSYEVADAVARAATATNAAAITAEQTAREAGDSALTTQIDEMAETVKSSVAPVIYGTASGDIASFEDGADSMPLKELTINITPVQSGEGNPSPENIRPISGWTGANVYLSPTEDDADATVYPISWSDTAGTVYGGMIDPLNGKLRANRASVDMGTLSWSRGTLGGHYFFQAGFAGRKFYGGTLAIPPICSCYAYWGNGTTSEIGAGCPDKQFASQTTVVTMRFRDDDYTDAASFKEAVTGQTVVYELAEPIEYDLDPVTINTLLGQNNLWADCGGVENCEYPADTKLYIDNKIAAIVATMSES